MDDPETPESDAEDAPAPRGAGRPPFEPKKEQRDKVKLLCAFGVHEALIAEHLGISKPTLLKYFRKELDFGLLEANAKVAQSLFRRATSDDPRDNSARFFWMKCRAGWKETPQQVELSGRDGGPIETKDVTPLELIESRIALLAARRSEAEDPSGSD